MLVAEHELDRAVLVRLEAARLAEGDVLVAQRRVDRAVEHQAAHPSGEEVRVGRAELGPVGEAEVVELLVADEVAAVGSQRPFGALGRVVQQLVEELAASRFIGLVRRAPAAAQFGLAQGFFLPAVQALGIGS